MGLVIIKAEIEGVTQYSPGAPIRTEKATGESHSDFEDRIWRERINVDSDGVAYIPAGALKNCLSEVAKYLSESVPGKGKATWTKHFEAGLSVFGDASLNVDESAFECDRRFVPSNGQRGGGTRVWKNFPVLKKWGCGFELYLIDPRLTDKAGIAKVEEYLSFAGQMIGLGRWRPRNNGCNGKFNIKAFKVTQKL